MYRVVLGVFAVMGVIGSACLVPAQNVSAPSKVNSAQAKQPYTIEFKITSVQTLANGTTITRESTEIQARDSEGRSMMSTTEETPEPGPSPHTYGHMNDPVAGTQSNWDSRTRTVHVITTPPSDLSHGCWANDAGNFRISRSEGPRPGKPAPNGTPLPDGGVLVPAQRSQPQMDDLGTTTILGIQVHGRRMTRTIRVGEIGNDQPIVSATEFWSAPSLGLTLRETSDDPRNGKRMREPASISLDEPDPALFQPPEGYEVNREELPAVPCPTRP